MHYRFGVRFASRGADACGRIDPTSSSGSAGEPAVRSFLPSSRYATGGRAWSRASRARRVLPTPGAPAMTMPAQERSPAITPRTIRSSSPRPVSGHALSTHKFQVTTAAVLHRRMTPGGCPVRSPRRARLCPAPRTRRTVRRRLSLPVSVALSRTAPAASPIPHPGSPCSRPCIEGCAAAREWHA